MSYPLILPEYTTQSTAAYKTAIDTCMANYKRTSGGLSVEAQASPNMTVLLRAGGYFKNSTVTMYEIAQQNLTITAAPTLPDNRKDIITLNSETGALLVTAGTPAPSPTAPACPTQHIPLAEVYVGGGVTTITNSNITDTRPSFWQGGGGLVIVQNVYTSSTTWNKDANLLYVISEAQGGGAGAGGVGGTTGNGTAGGTSSFGSHNSATGGSGGASGNNANQYWQGGAGGVGSGGDINIAGGAGSPGLCGSLGAGGNGGNSYFGGGARGQANIDANGTAAGNYGAGGSGGSRNAVTITGGGGGGGGGYSRKLIAAAALGSSETVTVGTGGGGHNGGTRTGGAGSGGLVVITEYRRA